MGRTILSEHSAPAMLLSVPAMVVSSLAVLSFIRTSFLFSSLPSSLSSSFSEAPPSTTDTRLDESRFELELGMNMVFFGLLGITFLSVGLLFIPGRNLSVQSERKYMGRENDIASKVMSGVGMSPFGP